MIFNLKKKKEKENRISSLGYKLTVWTDQGTFLMNQFGFSFFLHVISLEHWAINLHIRKTKFLLWFEKSSISPTPTKREMVH